MPRRKRDVPFSRQYHHQRLNIDEGRCRYGRAHDMTGSPYRGTCVACRARMRAAATRTRDAERAPFRRIAS